MLKMSDLILAIGDENVVFQNLDQCIVSADYGAKKGTTLTFGTSEPCLLPTKRIGLVLWLDRDAVADAIVKSKLVQEQGS